MKTITKLFSLAVLALGSLVAPLAHAGFLSGTIIVNQNRDRVTQKKKIKQIVVALGEEHTDNDQSDYLKVVKPLLKDKHVQFILEGKSEDANKITFKEKQAFLNRFYFYAQHPGRNPATIELCDWRTGKISKLIDFFISVDSALNRLKDLSIASITTLGKELNQNYTAILKELWSLTPWMIANAICEGNIEDFPEPVIRQLNDNYNAFITAVKKYLKKDDCTNKELEKAFSNVLGFAIKEKNLKNTPKTTKLSDDLITKLQQSFQEIQKQCGTDPDQNILSYFFNSAVNKENFETITTEVLFETPWFKSLIDALGDYGLIIGAKKSAERFPVTIVLAGRDHIDALLKQFQEKEGYTEEFSIQVQDDQEELTVDEFKALFEELSDVRKKQEPIKSKRKLEFIEPNENLPNSEMPHQKKLNALKSQK